MLRSLYRLSDRDIIKSVQVIAANMLKFQLQTMWLLSFGIYHWLTIASELRVFRFSDFYPTDK